MEEGKKSSSNKRSGGDETSSVTADGRSRSFGKKCGHLAKKQRAKFYILRRCIAMLVCWRDRNDQ
ncbi:small polypeptide DEVIL 16-like [Apium graveolens]|uniref:small polypeptide DEVIL 16-like n=1 Tax=Apium graveolens TaxID=4045 RepID=UPI003D79CEAB